MLVAEASSLTLQSGREHSFMFTSHTYSFGDSQKEEKESSIPSSLRGCSESHLSEDTDVLILNKFSGADGWGWHWAVLYTLNSLAPHCTPPKGTDSCCTVPQSFPCSPYILCLLRSAKPFRGRPGLRPIAWVTEIMVASLPQ